MEHSKNQSIPKVAIYCRVAGTNQTDTYAIESQRERLRIFANQQGIEVAAEYLDNGYGGNSLDRPGFSQMEADIAEGKIDTIILRCVDRIVRNHVIRESWMQKMKKKGIKFIALDGSHEPILPDNALVELMQKYAKSTRGRSFRGRGKATS